MNRAAYNRLWRHQTKRKASIPKLLEQPALLTDRVQPIRRPVPRLRKS